MFLLFDLFLLIPASLALYFGIKLFTQPEFVKKYIRYKNKLYGVKTNITSKSLQVGKIWGAFFCLLGIYFLFIVLGAHLLDVILPLLIHR